MEKDKRSSSKDSSQTATDTIKKIMVERCMLTL
jgi:hypothetical protein